MSLADQQEEDFEMALKHSMQQHESPEPKRIKPRDNTGTREETPQHMEESPEFKNRREQRELLVAAAEKRRVATNSDVEMEEKNVESGKDLKAAEVKKDMEIASSEVDRKGKGVEFEVRSGVSETSLTAWEANKLFFMIFGREVSKDVLSQWSNQGIRFSADPETSMGLVQHEGGPCGVLAPLQAFALKYLLFNREESDNVAQTIPINFILGKAPENEYVAADIFTSLSEERKSRALVQSMSEILFVCGRNDRAVIASLNIFSSDFVGSANGSEDEVIAKVLERLSVDSASDLQKVLRVHTCTSRLNSLQMLEAMLPIFRSRMGALLFLISALLSRGLENVEEDRDDPSQPLVTAPFGHASQEIVNLLLSGSAVANVFDGKMDLGGGMFVKGISTAVEVGFLTLLEFLNFCKVGQHLKCPKWPIWVVGSDSHYTVLFGLDPKVQEENELEYRETKIRRAFDGQDQSGGGGFISVEGFRQVIKESNISLPYEKLKNLCSSGFIVWSEFWQVLLDVDKSFGGMKDSSGLLGKKIFDLYHFNGIAKSIPNSQVPVQRPRLTKLRVTVPPRWSQEEFMSQLPGAKLYGGEVSKPQHAALVNCIRTRWPRAVCNWEGDPPSIV